MSLEVKALELSDDVDILLQSADPINDGEGHGAYTITTAIDFCSNLKGTAIEAYMEELGNLRDLLQNYYTLFASDCELVRELARQFYEADKSMALQAGISDVAG